LCPKFVRPLKWNQNLFFEKTLGKHKFHLSIILDLKCHTSSSKEKIHDTYLVLSLNEIAT